MRFHGVSQAGRKITTLFLAVTGSRAQLWTLFVEILWLMKISACLRPHDKHFLIKAPIGNVERLGVASERRGGGVGIIALDFRAFMSHVSPTLQCVRRQALKKTTERGRNCARYLRDISSDIRGFNARFEPSRLCLLRVSDVGP